MPIRSGKWLCLAMLSGPALAGSLGVIGPTYPVIEENLITMMQKKMKSMQDSGELAKQQQEAKDRVLRSIESPAPVSGVTTTINRAMHYYDPSMIVEQTIRDPSGKVIVPAGTRINPLDHIGLSTKWVFFDGRDPEQAGKVLAMLKKSGARIKPILVGGSYMQTMREWQRPVYFDQFGQLVHRFTISHVPAIVSQDGNRLKVEEIPTKELQ